MQYIVNSYMKFLTIKKLSVKDVIKFQLYN